MAWTLGRRDVKRSCDAATRPPLGWWAHARRCPRPASRGTGSRGGRQRGAGARCCGSAAGAPATTAHPHARQRQASLQGAAGEERAFENALARHIDEPDTPSARARRPAVGHKSAIDRKRRYELLVEDVRNICAAGAYELLNRTCAARQERSTMQKPRARARHRRLPPRRRADCLERPRLAAAAPHPHPRPPPSFPRSREASRSKKKKAPPRTRGAQPARARARARAPTPRRPAARPAPLSPPPPRLPATTLLLTHLGAPAPRTTCCSADSPFFHFSYFFFFG